MLPFLAIIGTTLLLCLEGRLLFQAVTRSQDTSILDWALGFPLGALTNALLFFVLHLLGIPFSLTSVWGAHALILGVLFFVSRKCGTAETPSLFDTPTDTLHLPPLVRRLCLLFLVLITLSTLVYAAWLPTFYWDSFTSWAMRAKQSLHAGTFLVEDVRQPQYPILLHSLQILFTVPIGWSDTVINIAMVLLSLSAFSSTYLLVRNTRGRDIALLTLTLLTGIPLVIIHLRQGYADIHVAEFALLSVLLLDIALQKSDRRLLLLSALLCAGAAWTKLEGIYYAVLPWILISMLKKQRSGIVPLIVLAAPWPLYVLLSGLRTSPHPVVFEVHFDLIPNLLESLFLLGTFGLHWWALTLGIAILLYRKHRSPSLLFGLISLLLIVCTYLFTEDARGLLHGDNFSRVMLLPTLVLTQAVTLGIAASWRGNRA